jgi:hypothetical protein
MKYAVVKRTVVATATVAFEDYVLEGEESTLETITKFEKENDELGEVLEFVNEADDVTVEVEVTQSDG